MLNRTGFSFDPYASAPSGRLHDPRYSSASPNMLMVDSSLETSPRDKDRHESE